MNFSYRWLLSVLGHDLTLADVCHTLTNGGIEVEESRDLGAGSGRVLVAQAIALAPHPQADKLRLVTVTTGDGPTKTIVCGATNVREGGRYALALEGARLPGSDAPLGRAVIRGVPSEGMLCSARELGWGDDADGLMELADDYKLGEPFDALVEVKVTPNRPDCLSIVGLARDIASLKGFRLPAIDADVEEANEMEAAETAASLTVEAPDRCPRYVARIVHNVKVGPSPLWLKRRLEASGVRSISNIVDIGNYVMLLTGHPLHAFDLGKLKGPGIVVRCATKDEPITLLDGRTIKLTEDDLVIADLEKPMVLAGIMGAQDAEVSETTNDVLIECACFSPQTIRRSSKRHGVSSESSYRFERGVARFDMIDAANLAAKLMQELAGGEVAPGVLDVAAPEPSRTLIPFSVERCNAFLGTSLSGYRVAEVLTHLGFDLHDALLSEEGAERMVVEPPPYRLDIATVYDVCEEIARAVGYNSIPARMPRLDLDPRSEPREVSLEQAARDAFFAAGLNEAITYSFIDPKLQAPFVAADAHVPLANPLTPEQAVMRSTLLVGLLQSTGVNQRRQFANVRLVEIGKTFHIAGGRAQTERIANVPVVESRDYVRESLTAAFVLGGMREATWRSSGKGRRVDFFDAKGIVEFVAETWQMEDRLVIDAPKASVPEWLHPGRAARLSWRDADFQTLPSGWVGQLHPEMASLFDLRDDQLIVAEFSLDPLLELPIAPTRFVPLSQHPEVARDLALVVDRGVRAGDLSRTMRQHGGEYLARIEPFDVYQGTGVADGKKSIAINLVFRATDRSLTDAEVNATVGGIVDALRSQHGAELRT